MIFNDDDFLELSGRVSEIEEALFGEDLDRKIDKRDKAVHDVDSLLIIQKRLVDLTSLVESLERENATLRTNYHPRKIWVNRKALPAVI